MAWPRTALLLVAGLLLAPGLVVGTPLTHSSPANLTWAAQFSEQFRVGILYPRWLAESFDGLGGPAFYFYPPLPFWIDALTSIVTLNVLAVHFRLGLTSILLLALSGLAMHAWLRRETASARAAFWGAVVYMAAPYHLLDHYVRGAIAEFTGYIFLPLVVLAIRLLADRRRGGLPLLAASYAGLAMSHLPTAMLVSATIIPIYILFRAWQLGESSAIRAFLAQSAMGGLLGIGLAAIYLVPALSLLDWISTDQFWSRFYRVENWFLIAPDRWPESYIMWVISFLSAGMALLAAGLALIARRMPAGDPKRRELAIWTASGLICLALMAGLVPWFWQLPGVGRVQFPWRLMVAVEFCAVTALCLAPLRSPLRAVRYLFAAALVALASGTVLMANEAAVRIEVAWKQVPRAQHDLKEYQPRGYPQDTRLAFTDLGLAPVANLPLVACSADARVCRAENGRFGTMQVEIESDRSTTVVVRRFFFPAWWLDGGLPIVPTKPLQLVSFVAPPGRTVAKLDRAMLPEEKWGWAISGLSLALLLIGWALAARLSKAQRTQ